ncbi:MAG: phenylalanine--tRNA ligase subunit beta [Candidatus Portnoybacteria bacterium]|nr:phenylalanine--tRNA ligase subunit beta [Candidatus Portnoybacteria bacterium]
MKFSANWLNEYLKKSVAPEKMVEFLTMHVFEVEGIDKKGKDSVLDIKVLPDRAHDCFSHIGIAKEIAAISNNQFLFPKINFKEDRSLKIKDFISVEIRNLDLCPRYSMQMVTNIKVGPSPEWMQERLIVCGLRPINNIVDITNYVMLETGQPLHAFDLDKLDTNTRIATNDTNKKTIIVRRAQNGEKIITLDEGRAERILDSDILVIADSEKPIGIAGIKGGRGPEIDNQTKRIVIEAANFNPINIRRSSKKLNLRTDASTRFENGLDPNLTLDALKRCVFLIGEFAEGKVVSGIIDIYSKKIKPRKILLAFSRAQTLLGIKITSQQIAAIFKRLAMPSKIIKKAKEEFIEVIAPTSRLDLLLPEDLIEEIGRLWGYDKIPAKMPQGVILPAIKNEDLIYEDKIRNILAGFGYAEVQNYSLISDGDQKLFDSDEIVEIINPLSQDQKYLRPSLIINLLKNARENLKYFSGIRLFEIGHTFIRENGSYVEKNKITGLICQKNILKHGENFFELKGLTEALLDKLGISDYWFDDAISQKYDWLKFVHPRRRAEIKSGDEAIGWVAEAKPELLAALEIKERVAIFELDFAGLKELASEERFYVPPSKYPAIIRDLAVIVDRDIKIEAVLNIIEIEGGALLQDVDIFDIYEGLEGNKKSLAFRLTFQSDERNLTDKEVNELMEKIIKVIEERGWEIRK